MNFLTASSVLEATSATSATLVAPSSSFAISTVAAADGRPGSAGGGGATDGLLLLLRGDDGEGDLSGAADGGFSEAAFLLDAVEDRGCFAVTVSFWSEKLCYFRRPKLPFWSIIKQRL